MTDVTGLLNWAGLQFMLRNYLNYHQMLQVYNLVLFSLTFGTQMLDFSDTIHLPLQLVLKMSSSCHYESQSRRHRFRPSLCATC
jgi:hypothetical protein